MDLDYFTFPTDIAGRIKDIVARITGENVQVFGAGGIIIATTQPGLMN